MAAGRLAADLRVRFGKERVFVDVDTIEYGVDFLERIRTALALARVLVVVVGDEWLAIADEQGRRRLDDPDDVVRFELASALKRGILVLPVLVEGARMPRRTELPPPLRSFASLNGLTLTDE